MLKWPYANPLISSFRWWRKLWYSRNFIRIIERKEEFSKKYSLINLDVSKFINKIEKINQRGEKVTSNQISNMANIHQSLLVAKKCEDLIYFVEDDYYLRM